jgi:hypothetical protein
MKRFFYAIFRFCARVNRSRKKRLTNNGLAVLSCTLLAGILGLDTNQTVTYQIFTFLLSIIGIAIIFSKFFRFRFNAVRFLPKFATVGVTLKYRILIHNKTSQSQNNLKLWENFADTCPSFQEFIETPEPGEEQRTPLDKYFGYYRWLWLIYRKQCATAKAIELPPLPPNSKTEVVCEITPSYRGVIRLIGLTVTRSDPFGIWNACKTISLPQSM